MEDVLIRVWFDAGPDVEEPWLVEVRESTEHEWARFAGKESELTALLSIARDVVTGG